MSPLRHIAAAALVLTGLCACKPLVVDDAAYVLYARQIVEQPLDPYGFRVLWYDRPEPALHVTVPPVLPYWLAAGMALLGEHPAAWKLWMLPFALLLTASLHDLLRRLAPGLETPVLWMTALSPPVLTGFDLMVDVPMLALGLGAVAATARAIAGRAPALAVGAGVLGGLAMQTKYPGVVPVAAAVALALAAGRPRVALTVGGVAGALFVGWEALALARYGESAFLYGLLESSTTRDASKPALAWSLALLSLLGATSGAAGLLALVALGARAGLVAGAAAAASLAFAVVPLLPAAPFAFAGRAEPDLLAPRPELLVFVPLGIALVLAFAALARQGARPRAPGALAALPPLWAGLEVAGFFLLSPFPAVRRILGLSVALTLWAAASASAAGRSRRLASAVAAWGVLLGLLFFGADLADALARRGAVAAAVERVRALDPEGRHRIWFTGHWGFRYEAERAGLHPVAPGISRLRAGDFLLVPRGVQRQPLALDPDDLARIGRVTRASASPWTSIPSFYTGPVPLRSQPDIHVSVSIYRARRDVTTRPAARRPVRSRSP